MGPVKRRVRKLLAEIRALVPGASPTQGSLALKELRRLARADAPKCDELEAWCDLLDEAIVYFALWSIWLTGTLEKDSSHYQRHRGYLAIFGGVSGDAIGIRELAAAGVSGPARTVARSVIEKCETLFVLLRDPERCREFSDPNNFKASNHFWYKYVRGKSLRDKAAYLNEHIPSLFGENTVAYWQEQAEHFSLATHPSAADGLFAILGAHRTADGLLWPAFLTKADPMIVRPVKVATLAMLDVVIGIDAAQRASDPVLGLSGADGMETLLEEAHTTMCALVIAVHKAMDEGWLDESPEPEWFKDL